jgi:ATP-dependent helicase/nuclease subunit A
VQRQANLRALVDKSLAHVKTRKTGLYGFIQYAEILKEKGVMTGQASLASEGDDVVRIKTIHKSKGLEFPIVILSGLQKKFMGGKDKSELSIHKDIGFSLPFYDNETRKTQKTLLQNIIKQKNRKESMEEEARILYVALTRAKDRLLLVGSVSDAEKALNNYQVLDVSNKKMTSSFLDMIAPTFLEKGLKCEWHTRIDVKRQLKSSSDFKEELQKRLLVEETSSDSISNEKMQREIAGRLSYKYPYTDELSSKSKYSVSELAVGQTQPIKQQFKQERATVVPLFLQGKKKLTSAEIGTAMHTVMERLNFKEAADKFAFGKADGRQFLSDFVQELEEKVILTPEAAEAVNLDLVERFFQSDIGRRAANADEIYKESPFNIIKEINGIETIVQGVIDCWFREGDEYVLLDYKLGYASDEEEIERLKETYASQVSLYSEALEIAKNIKISEKYLYLFAKSLTVKM